MTASRLDFGQQMSRKNLRLKLAFSTRSLPLAVLQQADASSKEDIEQLKYAA